MRSRILIWMGAALFAAALSGAAEAALLIDDFDGGTTNKMGLRSSTYSQEPSKALAVRGKEDAKKTGLGGLVLKYDKKNSGGPYDSGGWCGYYTLLKKGTQYFDAKPYKKITFWVKGETGAENFVLGLADKHWDEAGDSVKSEPIGKYLPGGKVTTQWQKAEVPLEDFLVDAGEIGSIAFCFESTVFPEGEGKGTIHVDDLMLE